MTAIEIVNIISKEKLENIVLDNKNIMTIILIICTVILFFTANVNGHISMGSDKLGNIVLFYLNGFLGIIIIMLIAIFIRKNRLLHRYNH